MRKPIVDQHQRRIIEQECIPVGCIPPAFVVAGGTVPGGYGGKALPPPPWTNWQTHGHLWKHYLPATSFVGGNETCCQLHAISSTFFIEFDILRSSSLLTSPLDQGPVNVSFKRSFILKTSHKNSATPVTTPSISEAVQSAPTVPTAQPSVAPTTPKQADRHMEPEAL